ncbi:Abi-alpha family protein [Erythrobacter aurantius]|uniref:Abi-alpha family protein n=1 Tax=Erythrobacter aurantius TaxID=2909249 RepID=UPI002079344C|nr:Abi-alpha family protein [Erythrobacter aurantius]
MVEPVISTGAALVGVSAWFLNKLFGPSADAIGEEIKKYGSDRLEKIFKRAEEKMKNGDVNSLPPGFAGLLIQKASFSEDSSILTDLWAGLISSASKNFSNRHSLYLDILSQISSEDAENLLKLYKGMYQENSTTWPPDKARFMRSLIFNRFEEAEEKDSEKEIMKDFPEFPFDGCVIYKRFETVREKSHPKGYRQIWRGYVQGTSIDISLMSLQRQALVQAFGFSKTDNNLSVYLEGFELSWLGAKFVYNCEGEI